MASPVTVDYLACLEVEEELRQALARMGVDVEFPPDFAFASWTGGWLLVRVRYLPTCALPLDGLVAPGVPGPREWHWSGFELDVSDVADQRRSVAFTTRSGDLLTMELLQLLCAAALTMLAHGELYDDTGVDVTRRSLAWALERANASIAESTHASRLFSACVSPLTETWAEHEANEAASDRNEHASFPDDIPGFNDEYDASALLLDVDDVPDFDDD